MDKRPFIIDCDTGADDAIALVAALCCEQIELLACTAVNGNVPLEYTAKNTKNVLAYLGSSVPVAKGAYRPIARRQNGYAQASHGDTGLGDIVLPDTKTPYAKETAPELIHKVALNQKGALELLAIGPMTNIALALILYPDTAKLVKHIYFMGGAIHGGNVTPTAEYNIWVDPEAARIVLESGIPLTMVGLDVTEKAFVTPEEKEDIRKIKTKAGGLVADLLEFMFTRGAKCTFMHDALALAAAIFPECMGYREGFVQVECEGKLTSGHTFVDFSNRICERTNASVAVEMDRKKFVDWMVSSIASGMAWDCREE